MRTRYFVAAVAICLLAASCKENPFTAAETSTGGSSKAANPSGIQTGFQVQDVYPSSDAQPTLVGDIPEGSPSIEFVGKGSILPTGGDIELPFRSYAYAKAQVRVRKIYTNNILQYLQDGDHYGNWGYDEVSNFVADTTIVLGAVNSDHIRTMKVYSITLSDIIKPDPGAIYHVEIRGREPLMTEDFWDSDWYFGDSETYQQRCKDLLASNIGLIVKGSDDALDVFVCNILTGSPVQGAKVKVHDYAQQEIARGTTDRDGRVRLTGCKAAHFVSANNQGNWSYLTLANGKALSTSNFDVSGSVAEDGIKAYLFGERGVWRPGDTLHIAAITMFEGEKLPDGHPLTAELRNPDGQTVQTISGRINGSDLYHFPFTTSPDAQTGRWSVVLNLGGKSFYKTVRIETIKPNNLDIDLDFGTKGPVPESGCVATASVNWLYGAPGSGLTLHTEAELSSVKTSFKGYESYVFSDKARDFERQTITLGDAITDENGKASVTLDFGLEKNSLPGMLSAQFNMRADEPEGGFSTGLSNAKISPFDTYVGLKTVYDKSAWGEEYLKAGTAHRFDVVTLDCEGKNVSGTSMLAEIFHVDWSWWWNASGEIASYMAGRARERLFSKTIESRGGKAEFTYDWSDAPMGLYYIRVKDLDGGHASSMICEVSRSEEKSSGEAEAAMHLKISSGKESYNAGETARLTIPSSAGSHALVTLEKGGRVISSEWFTCKSGTTELRIPLTGEMAPNVYAFVTLLQPHGNTLNDAPIRLYGVQNINVGDSNTKLRPVLDIPSQVKPESTVSFKVREKDGRPMRYVVALVDEGLLSLTGFKTPDAWNSFYAKEALRVRTWDLYDEVIGAYGGKIEQLFAIGGDDEATGPAKRNKADRFPPVVKWLGPFELKSGGKASHSVTLPQYIGSLRVMVIATDGHAQGSLATDVTVSKPMMVKMTLPRTLSTDETLSVPVTVMALEDGVGKVKLHIRTDGPVKVEGEDTMVIDCPGAGQQTGYFKLKVSDTPGVAEVSVSAETAKDKSASSTSIDVLLPNPETTRVQAFTIKAGAKAGADAEIFGIQGTNKVKVECSSIPAINLGPRLKYLTEYPYGCLEQTVSGAFPQLYIDKVMECDDALKAKMAGHIEAVIRKLHSFRTPSGAMGYWPGNTYGNDFCTVYALHFLLEAESAGYAVPGDLKNSLISCLSSNLAGKQKDKDYFTRAYGLYALALAGKPLRSAMNNMRENISSMDAGAVWMLAAAYAADGKKQVATQLTDGLGYANSRWSAYGSEDRNRAVALKVLGATGKNDEAFKLAIKVAGNLSDPSHYMSTQATAWSLGSICKYAAENAGSGIDVAMAAGGKNYKISSQKALASCEPAVNGSPMPLELVNNGSGTVYVTVATSGVSASGSEVATESSLKLKVEYVDDGGSPVNVKTLERGQSFKAVVTVTNPGKERVSDLALCEKMPSGWEIRNDRVWSGNAGVPAGLDYQDIRDDRVLSFFSLEGGKSVTVMTKLVAAYPGKFYLPEVSCGAMYDGTVSASIPGKWIEVK